MIKQRKPRPPEQPMTVFDGRSIWQRNEFPRKEVNTSGWGPSWVAAKCTLKNPFCWTPTKNFWFAGKEYKAELPCAAWTGADFGYIVQRKLDGQLQWGKE